MRQDLYAMILVGVVYPNGILAMVLFHVVSANASFTLSVREPFKEHGAQDPTSLCGFDPMKVLILTHSKQNAI